MAERLTDEQIDEFKETFKLYDNNRAGHITRTAMGNLLRTLHDNLSDYEVNYIIEEGVNKDGGEFIYFPQFLDFFGRMPRTDTDPEEELKEAFKVFDKDQNGFISLEELRLQMENLGEDLTDEEVLEMMEEADIDGDGQLNYEEFVRVMRAK